MTDRAAWRLLADSTHCGALNMAVDEAILGCVASGESPPTLRFYHWEPACLSIGYSQKVAEFNLRALGDRGWQMVRRPSGGRAVLHRDEVTYSIAAPGDDWRVAGGVLESYRRISGAFLQGLAALGVGLIDEKDGDAEGPRSAACFDAPSRHELTAAGRKLIGSAQWRHGSGVLQHGSVPLSGDVAEVVDYLTLAAPDRDRARALLRRRAGTMEQALGRQVTFAEVAEAIARGLSETLAIDWTPGEPTPREKALAAELLTTRYGTDAWNFRL